MQVLGLDLQDQRAPRRNIFIDGAERFRCAEVFLQPNSTGIEASGFHDTCFPSIMNRDVHIRKVFVSQCRAVRWTGTFQRAGKRLFKELTTSAPSSMKNKVVAPPERLCSECFPQLMWTSKGEYGDSGPRASTFCSVSFF